MLSRRLLRIKVIKELYAHLKSESDSLTASLKELKASVDKTYDLYHLVLHLVADVAGYAEERIELARNKKLPTTEDLNPNRRFVDNALVAQIAQSRALNDYLKKHKLSWAASPELIKTLYNDLAASDFYAKYMSASTVAVDGERASRRAAQALAVPSPAPVTYRDDVRLVEEFYMQIVAESDQAEEVLEEQSILWADDLDFATIMALRTIAACKVGQEDIPLLPQFKNDDDRRFAKELFTAALTGYDEYLTYVERFAQNWDVERIALLDCLIMVIAIAEMVTFPSIPVKVTLDEYIEISKYYSTPGSSVFINGILDKVVEELRATGRMEKTGRGLL